MERGQENLVRRLSAVPGHRGPGPAGLQTAEGGEGGATRGRDRGGRVMPRWLLGPDRAGLAAREVRGALEPKASGEAGRRGGVNGGEA